MTAGPKYFGKYRATVLSTADELVQGRIQVQLSDRYGLFPSTWALPAVPFAGKGSAGVIALPQTGSAVWVEFEAGDPDCPIWTGAFWPDPAGAPPLATAGTPATPNIHLQTTTGVSVTLSDLPAAQIRVSTPTGATIVIGTAGIKISNGPGLASIELRGKSVIINDGALVVT